MIQGTLLLLTLLLTLMAQRPTNKQLTKMKDLEKMFKQQEKSGLSVAKFCKKKGIHQSKYYYWKRRYEEQKEKGLIDKRQGVVYRVPKQRRNFITQYKIKNPSSSCRELAEEFKKKYGETIHFTHVAQILREENLNDPVGRKPKKGTKKTPS